MATGESKPKDTGWKEPLLRSGLPFEFFVSREFERAGFGVDGEFAFTRKERSGLEVECSVDLSATNFIMARSEGDLSGMEAQLDLLVECKYNVPGTSWIFFPRPRAPHPLPGLTVIDHLTGGYIADKTFARFPSEAPPCVKGVSLHVKSDSKSEAQDQTIHNGLNQLRYAMPEVVRRSLNDQLLFGDEGGFPIYLIGSILVCTADLRVLNPDITLESYRAANHLDDVSTAAPFLVVANAAGPDLTKSFTQIYEEWHGQNGGAAQARITEKSKAIRQAGLQRGLSGLSIRPLFRAAVRDVLIVNFSSLGTVLPMLLQKATRSLELCRKVISFEE